jgi:pilus assembly protein CpaB
MGSKKILVLVMAGVAAILSLFLIRGLAVSKDKKPAPMMAAAPAAPAMTYVAVAAHDLNIGDRLGENDLTWKSWPTDNVIAAYVTNGAVASLGGNSTVAKAAGGALTAADNAKQKALGMQDTPGGVFLGSVVKEAIRQNEPMILDKVVRAGSSGIMAVRLEPGMRAMAIPLSPESSAGGFVLPGDHVDVVQTRKMDGNNVTSNTVMKNVRVLAIDQATAPSAKGGASTLGATATLEVAPGQAENLVLARAQGDLTLVLRSYADAAGPTLDGVLKKAEAMMAPPVVRVYRNAQPTEVKVAR